MTYVQFLQKLQKLGLGQVSRMTSGGYDVARVGRPSEVVFPYMFRSFPIILDKGVETVIDEEIIDAVLRMFGQTRERFDPAN
jgi:hypothetical protein